MLVPTGLLSISEDVSDVLAFGAELAIDADVAGILSVLAQDVRHTAEEVGVRFDIRGQRFRILGIDADRRRRLMLEEARAVREPNRLVIRHSLRALRDAAGVCDQLAVLTREGPFYSAVEIVHSDLAVCRVRLESIE